LLAGQISYPMIESAAVGAEFHCLDCVILLLGCVSCQEAKFIVVGPNFSVVEGFNGLDGPHLILH
jgi:hypothetical protein